MSSSRVCKLSLDAIKEKLFSKDGLDVQIGRLGERQVCVRSSKESISWDSLALRILELNEVSLGDRAALIGEAIHLYKETEKLVDKTWITWFSVLFRDNVLHFFLPWYFVYSKTTYERLFSEQEQIPRERREQTVRALNSWLKEAPENEHGQRRAFKRRIETAIALNSKSLYLNGADHDFRSLTSLPINLDLQYVESLKCYYFDKLESLPQSLNLSNLVSLDLVRFPSLKALPFDVKVRCRLKDLYLRECAALESLPNGLDLSGLESLDLSKCTALKSLPIDSKFHCLKKLNLSGCAALESLPDGLNSLQLETFNLYGCAALESLPTGLDLSDLESLDLSRCSALKSLPIDLKFRCLKDLNLSKCTSLESLPDELNFSQLETLDLTACSALESLSEDMDLLNLKEFYLCGCTTLSVLPDNLNLPSLESLDLSNCSDLQYLPPLPLPNLESLDLTDCKQITELPLILGDSPNLRGIRIKGTQISRESCYAILETCRRKRAKMHPLQTKLPLWRAYAGKDAPELDFLLEFSDSEKESISEWLFRLSKTKDFQRNQRALASIVCTMLADLTHKSFRDQFLNQIEVNNVNCADRAAMAFNELYVMWKVAVPKEGMSEKQKFDLLQGIAKTLTLREILTPKILQQGESVEIFLYYECKLRKRLELVTAIETMAYKEIGRRSEINKEELIQEVKAKYVDKIFEIPLFEKFFSEDLVAQKDLEKTLEPIDVAFHELDPKAMNSKEYQDACDQSQKDREKAEKAFKKDWLLQKLAFFNGSSSGSSSHS